MTRKNTPAIRNAVLPLTATAVAVGAFLGLPVMKAIAAAQDRIAPSRIVPRLPAELNIVRPETINPSTRQLLSIADRALMDEGLARRISADPDSVASQYNLSDTERLVLRHMTPEQFEIARTDAARVRADRLAAVGSANLPASAINEKLIAKGMVVGRAILAAMGRSYLEAANAHSCCPWGKAIQLGVNAERVLYDRIFDGRTNLDVGQPAIDMRPPGPTLRGLDVPSRD